jgi:hypothetical protein
VAHTCKSQLLRRLRLGESWLEGSPGKQFSDPISKITRAKWTIEVWLEQ